MSNSLFCNCCYPNPSGNPVDPDGHPSIFGGFSMACSMSIKPLVSEAAYFYLQDFGLSKTTIRRIATITIVAASCLLVTNWFISILCWILSIS
jgi:hypothetical protein